MIQSIALENFKNHVRTELTDLGRMTVLVGPNGAGKSSILQAAWVVLPAVKAIEAGGHRFKDAVDQVYRSRREESAASTGQCIVVFSVHAETWRVHFGWTRGSEPPSEFSGLRREDSAGTPPDAIAEPSVLKALEATVWLALVPRRIEEPSVADSTAPRIGRDGSGTASVFASMQMSQPRLAIAVSDAVSKVVPTVMAVRTRRVKVQQTKGRPIRVDATTVPFSDGEDMIGEQLVFDMLSGNDVSAHAASAGTLIVTALATAIMAQSGPRVVLLDDVESGLHPEAQREVIAMLREMCAQDPDLQILMTTHSPYVVDGFDPKDVWVVVADAEGLAHARRLSDHPDAARAQQTLATGELWTAFGEDWALAPGPEKNAG